MTLNERHTLLEDLDVFISEKKGLLKSVLTALNWKEEFVNNENKVKCPINSNHLVPESSLAKHIEKCSWINQGYTLDDIDDQPPDSDFFYHSVSSVVSVTVDKVKQQSILMNKGLLATEKQDFDNPSSHQTVDNLSLELNPEQRLAIYDHIVEEGKAVKHPKNVALEDLMFDFESKHDQGDKPKSNLELLAEQRDYKRRRQSYRAKNVHITKKSYTEVMKEVIENQITYLTETRKQEEAESEKTRQESSYSKSGKEDSVRKSRHREYSPESRSRSRSRSPKRHKHKHKRSRSRSKSRSRHKHKKSHKKHKKTKD